MHADNILELKLGSCGRLCIGNGYGKGFGIGTVICSSAIIYDMIYVFIGLLTNLQNQHTDFQDNPGFHRVLRVLFRFAVIK